MIVKLVLSPDQLAALHNALRDKGNLCQQYMHHSLGHGCEIESREEAPLITIKDCRGKENDDPSQRTKNPVPNYNVTLEVRERFQLEKDAEWVKTPIHPLIAVFNAIGLFPHDKE